MRLYSGRIGICSQEVVRALVQEKDIEVANPAEAQLDVAAVLKEYVRMEKEIIERAKDLMEQRGLGRDQFGRVKKLVAEEKQFGTGDDSVGYIADQIIETLMQSNNIDEVFSDDNTLRSHIVVVLRRQMQADDELEDEVRKRIKNLQEGTSAWDIEYRKAMSQIKRAKGMED